MIENIITGAVGGLAYALLGLANKEKREGFDWTKMAPTIIIAGAIGGIAGYSGVDYGIVAEGSMAAGITVIVQKAWKAIRTKFNF